MGNFIYGKNTGFSLILFYVDLKVNFIFSNHALQQISLRNISLRVVQQVMENPDQITKQENKSIYQSLIHEGDKAYLIRIFVNNLVNPAVVITAYKTSKIYKYL